MKIRHKYPSKVVLRGRNMKFIELQIRNIRERNKSRKHEMYKTCLKKILFGACNAKVRRLIACIHDDDALLAKLEKIERCIASNLRRSIVKLSVLLSGRFMLVISEALVV